MKKTIAIFSIIALFFCQAAQSQNEKTVIKSITPGVRAKSDADQEKKAAEWVASLNLNDAAREARTKELVATHLKTIRDWHNEHSYTNLPAGINPVTGKPLSILDRQIIANSAMPGSVHQNLLDGLKKDLRPEQVEMILDKYTVGKVAFTLAGIRLLCQTLPPRKRLLSLLI